MNRAHVSSSIGDHVESFSLFIVTIHLTHSLGDTWRRVEFDRKKKEEMETPREGEREAEYIVLQ